MSRITKAVIPAAGFGTRMLPAAKAVPKELLPVIDRPTIQYVVEEAAAAGCDDVILVTSQDKPALINHFRKNERLEARLRAGGKENLLAPINALIDKVRIRPVDQPQQKGLGDAVLRAREAVGDEPFFSGVPAPAQQLVDAHARLGTSVIGLEEVPPEKVDRYGIIGGESIGDGLIRIETLVEKPSRETAPSRLAIAARYVLTPRVFECLEQTPPGKGGEVQLTDAMRLMLSRGEAIHGVVLRARRHDIGNPVDWLKTNLIFAARDEELWRQIAPLVKTLLDET
jgi:UTP--glucose-1-phosphate uridylyltransferase